MQKLYNIFYIAGLFGEPQDIHYYPNIEKNIDTSGVLIMTYDGFVSIAVAAKDSKGRQDGIIQGTKGIIRTEISPNMVGKASLELYDGYKEEHDDGYAKERLIPEFKAFIRMINTNDHAGCYEMLDKSLLVSKIQTEARTAQGIIFPADNE